MKTIIPWFLIATVLSACVKEEPITPDCSGGDCLPFEVQDATLCYPGELFTDPCDYYLVYDSVNYWGPVFNPNNSDEIGFISNKIILHNGVVSSTCCLKFEVFNHRTDTKLWEYVFPEYGYPFNQLDWSVEGEIIYGANDGNIYKFSPENTDPEIITEGGGPVWNISGTRFAYGKEFLGPILIANQIGETLDTLGVERQFLINDWSESGKLLYDWSYWDFNLNLNIDLPQLNSSLSSSLSGWKKWGVNDNEIVITNIDKGIQLYKIGNESLTDIQPNCSGKYYGQLAVSRDKKYIASVVIKWTILSEDSLFSSPQIRVMNMDGSDERILDIEP